MFTKYRKPVGEEIFTNLFYTCKERLFGYVLAVSHSHYTAEEITQEIFLKLWLIRHNLETIENGEAYLFAIARNKVLNYLRKAHYDEKLFTEIKNRMRPVSNDVEEHISLLESDRLIQEAITLLSPQRQLVYRLSRLQGMNHQEIARKMQLSRNTVKNHLVQSLRFIRSYLDNNGFFLLGVFLLEHNIF
jgi:RNA polymerase sigma-70 factor (ECF subfamily)